MDTAAAYVWIAVLAGSYGVGEASKALTSAAVGLLVEKNTLHLGDEIQVQVPHGQIHARVTGRVIENFAPPLGLFAADILPPWRSIKERQIERPIPSPSGLLVMNGSKIDSRLMASTRSSIPFSLS
jgi:hypothetical protein